MTVTACFVYKVIKDLPFGIGLTSPYFFVKSVCLVYTKMFAKFDEIPAMTLQDIKESKWYGRTDGQRENSIPYTNKVCGGYNMVSSNVECTIQVNVLRVLALYNILGNCPL